MKKNIIKNIIRDVINEHFINSNPVRKKLNMYIPNNVWKIKEILNKNGYDLYIIGGAVRDALYEKKPKDYDLVTNATFETIQQLFANQPFVNKLLSIGEKFAISFLITTDGDYELATYRSDVGGGRKSTVKYENSLKKDVERRDFTINALAYDLDTKEVIDYVGGLDDIKNNRLNAVGNADDRFIDDPLRKLRAVRFAARMNNKLSPETEKALLKSNSMKDINGGIVSVERRKEEYFKGIKTALSVKYYLSLLLKFNLFEKIFEGVSLNVNPASFIDSHNPIVVTANILFNIFDISKMQDLEKELVKLKYSNKNGDMEAPRIIFLMFLKNVWLNKLFNFNTFYKLKKRYKLIEFKCRNDIQEFANYNNIDSKFLQALMTFFNYSLSKEDKDEILKNGIKIGPEYGQKIKEKEFEIFKEKYQ